jgi:hypothetical protein
MESETIGIILGVVSIPGLLLFGNQANKYSEQIKRHDRGETTEQINIKSIKVLFNIFATVTVICLLGVLTAAVLLYDWLEY